ncbi:MAG: GNAT family N-acetyltransferase [Acidimicrobiales bacterium]
MWVLERLRSDHADAVLTFEIENRAFFSATISDRGDTYFEHFAEHHRSCLNEQDAGTCAYYVVVDERGTVLGRFNLYEINDGMAEVGYRVDERATGRGLATDALGSLCALAEQELRLTTLTARTSDENVASQRVLEKCGFVVTGPVEVGGRMGRGYRYAGGEVGGGLTESDALGIWHVLDRGGAMGETPADGARVSPRDATVKE